jgi:phenylacetic acid degradation protein paaN
MSASLFSTHRPILDAALSAIHDRRFHAQWPEMPSPKIYGDTAQADGEAAFRALLGKRFEGLGEESGTPWHGSEESPYGFPLGITYPAPPVDALLRRAEAARGSWAALSPADRAGLLTEALVASAKQFFPIAYATMHTTGQGFLMAFQASGPHAWDRALEAVALGYEELTRFASAATWEKPVGKAVVTLRKNYRVVGRGTGLVIGCSTFPVWNSFPGIFADLVTGNPVIVKPHPGAVLPLAIAVAELRRVFAAHGAPEDAVQLAVDGESLIAKELAEHPGIAIIDYTGNSAFGEYLERLPGKTVFTEKAGVNAAILDSVDALDPVLENLAFSLSLYSGQMCTTPQNVFIPRAGVRSAEGWVPYEDVVRRLIEKIDGIAGNEKVGPGTFGAVQHPATLERISTAAQLPCRVLRASAPVAQPGFAQARSVSPLLLEVLPGQAEVYQREMFGPIVFIIPTSGTDESLALARDSAARAGAITFALWSVDEDVIARVEDAMMAAGAPVSVNLTGPIWVNQAAAFSDFHVTAGNPAGNASLVNPEFIVRRFFVAGSRRKEKDA